MYDATLPHCGYVKCFYHVVGLINTMLLANCVSLFFLQLLAFALLTLFFFLNPQTHVS